MRKEKKGTPQPKKNSRANPKSPGSFNFKFKDRAAYNLSIERLEEELRSDSAPVWKPKEKVSPTMVEMGPYLCVLYARYYDNHLNRALIAEPFMEYAPDKKEAKIRFHITESFAEPVTILTVLSALGMTDTFFGTTVREQRVSTRRNCCFVWKQILTHFRSDSSDQGGF